MYDVCMPDGRYEVYELDMLKHAADSGLFYVLAIVT